MKHRLLLSVAACFFLFSCHKLEEPMPDSELPTEETDLSPSAIFQSFAGNYATQDTFYQRIQVFDSSSSYHLEDVPPEPKGSKRITIEYLPEEEIFLYTGDTLTYMNLYIGQEAAVKVRTKTDGSFYWSDGQYYTPTHVSGQILGDSISCKKGTYSNQSGSGSSHRYNGKRE